MEITHKEKARKPAYALAYARSLPRLVEIAREHGYALGVHGSMARDMDLIAAPWTVTATDAATLIEAIRAEVNGVVVDDEHPVEGWPFKSPAYRPHGRVAWSIYLDAELGAPYLDISVMPRQEPHPSRGGRGE